MVKKREEDRMENIEPNEGRELVHRVAKEWVREAELIPVRHLSLDLDEPLSGWELALLERGVEILEDDLGRPCVRRKVLGELLREERERLARIEAESAARVAAAVAPLPGGLPALEGGSAMESLMANDPGYRSPSEEFGQRPKPRFLEEALEAGARHQAAAQAEAEAKKAARGEDG
jgi:hypothetical protein